MSGWHAAIWCVGLLLTGCSATETPVRGAAGRAAGYDDGRPRLNVEVLADAGGMTVWTGLPAATLVFEERDGTYQARYSLDIVVRAAPGGALVTRVRTTDTVRVAHLADTQTFRELLESHRLEAPPGSYTVEVDARDDLRGVGDRVQVRTEVPAPGVLALSDVRLDARLPGDTLRPLLALDVPTGLDTLRASIVCSHVPLQTDARVIATLLAFDTDTGAALSPFDYAGLGSLAYRGVRPERAETLQVSRQLLRGAAEEVVVEVGLPPLGPGLYRVDVGVEGMEIAPHQRSRLLVVRPRGFPRVTTLDEMIDALAYLLTPRERQALQADTALDARRARFDRFWARAAPNREAAAVLMRRYYSRVEEANRRFSSFKAGWQTDRGMVFVVLGPPVHVETWPDREVWYYSFDDTDATRTYVFERGRSGEQVQPFPHYVLVRGPAYQRHWQRAVEGWRRGRR